MGCNEAGLARFYEVDSRSSRLAEPCRSSTRQLLSNGFHSDSRRYSSFENRIRCGSIRGAVSGTQWDTKYPSGSVGRCTRYDPFGLAGRDWLALGLAQMETLCKVAGAPKHLRHSFSLHRTLVRAHCLGSPRNWVGRPYLV